MPGTTSGTPGLLSSGVKAVDEVLGGLLLGDNVVWVSDDPALFDVVESGVLASASGWARRRIYVTAERSPDQVAREVGGDVTILDARAGGDHDDPTVLEQRLVATARDEGPMCVVLDGLDSFAKRWGDSNTAAFFRRVCPRLFDLDAVAYWRAPQPAVSRRLVERVTGLSQSVVELSKKRLRIVKAEGRPHASARRLLRAHIEAGELAVEPERAAGRLARSLARLRRERHLSQSELARIAGVSASAISQAEAGLHALSLDTMLVLADRLGVSVDELLAVAPPPAYRLARRDVAGRGAGIVPLVDDPKSGLHAFLVRLGAGESKQAPREYKGVELVLVAAGLVQVQCGSDTPLLRTGDAALVTTVPVASWRNLTADPAALFWVVLVA